jgi:hypothetical protein
VLEKIKDKGERDHEQIQSILDVMGRIASIFSWSSIKVLQILIIQTSEEEEAPSAP